MWHLRILANSATVRFGLTDLLGPFFTTLGRGRWGQRLLVLVGVGADAKRVWVARR